MTLAASQGAQIMAQSRTRIERVDSTLIDKQRDAQQVISRYRVDSLMGSDYELHYRINTSTLSPTMGNNGGELSALESLIISLADQPESEVKSIVIVGYASPDGPQTFNAELAKARAENFTKYADKRFALQQKYKVEQRSVAQKWEAITPAVESHPTPRKNEVIAIVGANIGEEEKQARLKAMPEVWDYLAKKILPAMRRVDVELSYQREDIVVSLTKVEPKPAPVEPKPVEPKSDPCDPCNCDVVDESITGIIVEMPRH